MSSFRFIASIHEQLRLGGNRLEQLGRLESADDAIMLYQFFYPTMKHTDPIRMLANEAASYYDVVKDSLCDDEPWMTLASESANNGTRNYTCGYVRALLKVEESFSKVAEQFNEIEARLLWRWAMHGKPVISKRTFFGTLARLHSLPIHILQSSMTIAMIAKVYNNPESVHGMERWWEYGMSPAPMRWKAYTSLVPPSENHYAVIVPEGEIKHVYQGKVRNRNGLLISKSGVKSGLLKQDGVYREIVTVSKKESHKPNHQSSYTVVLDSVDPKKAFFPDGYYNQRMMSATKTLMTTNKDWDDIVNALQNDDVRSVRLIPIDGSFKPDAIGGYVMHADRTKVFLRANMDVMGRGPTYLQALDGISEYITVGETEHIPNWRYNEDLDRECIVIEVAAVRVSEKGQLLNFTVVGRRDDLGITDVTQFTELVERGMQV
ncbi:MAG: hypothetical protein CMI60_09120 [Parvibaculum sp.]|nr:hypothetical protein [Parvibaculum sp.]